MTLLRNPETETASPKRKKRLVVKLLAAIGALAIFWAVAGIFLYVAPPADEPQHADVLFVLGPPDQRMGYAEQLMQHGYAPTLAVSSPVGKDGRFEADKCGALTGLSALTPILSPQGEARALKNLSAQYGWKSANVLTAQFHVTRARARVIVSRCYGGNLHMVADRTGLPLISWTKPFRSWAYQYLYRSAAFVKVAIHPDC